MVSNSQYVRAPWCSYPFFCLCWTFCTKSEQILPSRIHDQLVFFPLQHSITQRFQYLFPDIWKEFLWFHYLFPDILLHCPSTTYHDPEFQRLGTFKGSLEHQNPENVLCPLPLPPEKHTSYSAGRGECKHVCAGMQPSSKCTASERNIQWRVVFITILYSLTVPASVIGYVLCPKQPT